MAIYKASIESGYTVIPNETAQNSNLTFEARGMLSLLLSLPVDWSVNKSWLIKQSNAGRDKVQSIINELVKHGYMSKTQPKDQKGQFTSNDYFVYPTPVNVKTVDGFAVNGESDTTKETVIQKKQNTNLVKATPDKKRFKYNKSHFSFAQAMLDRIKAVAPAVKSVNLERWANDIRLLCEVDEVNIHEAWKVFKWANADSFWQTNILSADKFRKQFAQLSAKMPKQQPQRTIKDFEV